MLSDCVIPCMAILILLAKLMIFCESSSWKSGATPYSHDLAPNLGSKHVSGARLSSNRDVKTPVENWLNEQGRDFNPAGLTLQPAQT
ncbi:hypothetical protein AVEN_46517-1 [Araneus ventricosus]|uniref:Uncharacterized protein n=1 Tax=Araneus ventricosus TaxID=182803 RepID=A0A4Y2HBQ0_ARAVE|nr:hypothetical protein AVEN_46517-1 [Araneus ventricosus]